MLNFKTLNWVYIIPFLQWLHALPLDLDSTVVELSKRQGSDCTTNKIKKIAYANVESGNITGRVTFIQYDGLTAIRVLSKFSGLTPGQHGFHIHASPVSTNCESTGAHFNPRNVSHGAWNAQTRHTGDLMALQAQANGEASHFYADPLISFEGENNIIGRAIVIHALADDLGLGGNENSTKTGNAGVEANSPAPVAPPPSNEPRTIVGVSSISSGNITGKVVFHDLGGQKGVRVVATFNGLTPGQHGFHIHTNPVSTDCDSTGGHFNPRNVSHGAWNAQTRHVGDMLALGADSSGSASVVYDDPLIKLEGENNIIGRSIVIHALADDLGLGGNENSTKTGNAGGRLVCANITSESRPPPKLAVAAFKNANITASVVFVQNSDKGLQVLAKFNGLTAGQHGFHIHENPVTTNCDSTGPHFNPGNATHGAWNATTRHLGDLKPLQVDANGTAILSYEDSFARLDGENNIVGRSVVVHALADDLGLGGNENSTKTGNAGGKRSS